MQLGRLYFNKENPTGCNPDKIFTDVFNSDPDLNLTPFFLVDHKDCSYVTQTRNVEK